MIQQKTPTVRVVRFERTPLGPGFTCNLYGLAFCTLDGLQLEPFMVIREADGSFGVMSLETFGIPGGEMLDLTNVTTWIKITDPRISKATRGLIRQAIIDHAMRVDAAT